MKPPSAPRRSSIVDVKRRLSEKSTNRKDVRSAGKERERYEHEKALEEARKV